MSKQTSSSRWVSQAKMPRRIRVWLLESGELQLVSTRTAKRQEQTSRYGKRVNIIGILELAKSLVYGLVVNSITSAYYLQLMDWQATQAAREFNALGGLR